MKKINLFIVALFIAFASSAQTTANFENLTLATDTFWSGSDLSGGFASGHAYFNNVYDTTYSYWSGGFIYSDKTDSTTAGYNNPASAITASGFGGSGNYAVGYDDGAGDAKIKLTQASAGKAVEGFYVTNTTYAYLSMLHGDNFEYAFNNDSADWYLLSITGWKNGAPVADTVNFYLADYRSPDSTQDYIINNWTWVNLLPLGPVDSLVFTVSGSETGQFGLNTPAYFALDNFVSENLTTIYDTLLYNQDTLINVFTGQDTTGGPFTVHIAGNDVGGASIVVDSVNLIWYIPQEGVAGTDTVIYTLCNNSQQCDTGEVIIDLLSPAGIHNINTLQTTAYPNPFSNSFSVYHTADVKTINLYDLEGRLIRVTPCNAGESVTSVETADLDAGTYIVKVISDQGTGIAKVIKQ